MRPLDHAGDSDPYPRQEEAFDSPAATSNTRTPDVPRRSLLSGIQFTLFLSLGLALFAIVLVVAIPSPPAPAARPASTGPPVSWTPNTVNERTAVGAPLQRLSLSFVSANELTNIQVRVVPELQPFLTVTPTAFPIIPAYEPIALEITFSAPEETVPGVYEGTIQLKGDGGESSQETNAKPLSITLEIVERVTLPVGESEVSFTAPPEWRVSLDEVDDISLYSPAAIHEIDAGGLVTPPDITITSLTNPTSLSISDFLDQYEQGWYATYDKIDFVVLNGHDAALLSDTAAPIPRVPEFAAFIFIEGNVIVETANLDSQQEFGDVLASFQIP